MRLFEDCAASSEADGKTMMALIEELFPICRSITGNGVRQTLAALKRYIPLDVNEVPSGTPVLDWMVPREWNIREAYIACPDGTRIADFAANNPIRFDSNGNLFFNSVNWLAQDEDLISIRPKSVTNRSLVMTAAQQTTFWWLAVLFMPLAAVGAGAYIWWNRR